MCSAGSRCRARRCQMTSSAMTLAPTHGTECRWEVLQGLDMLPNRTSCAADCRPETVLWRVRERQMWVLPQGCQCRAHCPPERQALLHLQLRNEAARLHSNENTRGWHRAPACAGTVAAAMRSLPWLLAHWITGGSQAIQFLFGFCRPAGRRPVGWWTPPQHCCV
jgi:hypothetical protein